MKGKAKGKIEGPVRMVETAGWRTHLAALGLLATAVLIYLPTVNAPFIYDDFEVIVFNPTIRSWDGVGEVLASGRPVRGLTLMFDYWLFGLNAAGYHLQNIFWHLVGSGLFYWLAYRLFGRARVAAVAALLFAVHPAHVEAVAGISHRKEMLAFVFMMLSYHGWLYRARRPVGGTAAAAIFLFLALMSKQVAAALPLFLIWRQWRARGSGSYGRGLVVAGGLIGLAGVLFVAGALASVPVLRDFDLFGRVSAGRLGDLDYLKNLATSFSVYPRHLWYLAFPVHLMIAHPIALTGWDNPLPWLGLALFGGLAVVAARRRGDTPEYWGAGWIFVNLLPIMNWVPSNEYFAERYLYIPSAGFCLIAAGLGERIYTLRSSPEVERAARAAAWPAVGLFILIILVSGLKDWGPLWWPAPGSWMMGRARALALAGSVLAVAATGAVMGLSSWRLDKRRWPVRALEFPLLYGLGLAALAGTVVMVEVLVSGRVGFPAFNPSEHINRWRELASGAAGGRPSGPSSSAGEWANILVFTVGGLAALLYGLIYYLRWTRDLAHRRLAGLMLAVAVTGMVTISSQRVGDWISPVKLWRSNVREDPESLLAWNNLGMAYLDLERFDLAARCFERAARLGPSQALVFKNWGMALLELDDPKAAAALERVIALDPGDLETRRSLADRYLELAERSSDPVQYQRAIIHYLALLEGDPGAEMAFYNLAICYLKTGQLDLARDMASRHLETHPGSPEGFKLLFMIDQKKRDFGH